MTDAVVGRFPGGRGRKRKRQVSWAAAELLEEVSSSTVAVRRYLTSLHKRRNVRNSSLPTSKVIYHPKETMMITLPFKIGSCCGEVVPGKLQCNLLF